MSSYTLKIFAAFIMLIDHIGACLFPQYLILRIIGRLAFPIFAFQIAIGYKHTKNKNKYIGRMFWFAILSQIPYMLFMDACGYTNNYIETNVGFTFLFALLCLYIIDLTKEKKQIYYLLLIIPILIATTLLNTDYSIYGVLTVILFYLLNTKNKFALLSLLFFILTAGCIKYGNMNSVEMYAILALLPIALYNGKKGLNSKYFFYIFYPAHFIILTCINYIFI